MFLKTNKIKALAVYTSTLLKEEYDFIQENLNHFSIVYIIPVSEENPVFLASSDVTIKEEWSDTIFGYERVIKQIVSDTKVSSDNIVVISKDIKHLKLVLPQPVGTILISNGNIKYEDIGSLPDLKLNSIKDLKGINVEMGYFSEVSSTILSPGSSFNDTGLIFTFEMERDEFKFNVIAGGRYFNSKHESFNCHQLSHRINKSKYETTQNKLFESLFIPMVNFINANSPIQGITRVPNRPSKPDRLKSLVESISKETEIQDYSEQLVCINDYPPHKTLSSSMRFQNVLDQFSVQYNFTGEHIIIIDDVFTTGSTVFECAKQLYKHGAGKVTVAVLGVNQFSNEFTKSISTCPNCNGKLQLKLNSKNNTAFFGCENYSNQENRCRYSENFLPGWTRIKNVTSFNPQSIEFSNDDYIF